MREFENPDHWNAAARQYRQTAHPFTARYAEAALARVALTPESRVLDVAAGTGALALAAARYPLAFDEVSTVALGTRTLAQAEQNFGAAAGATLGARSTFALSTTASASR